MVWHIFNVTYLEACDVAGVSCICFGCSRLASEVEYLMRENKTLINCLSESRKRMALIQGGETS